MSISKLQDLIDKKAEISLKEDLKNLQRLRSQLPENISSIFNQLKVNFGTSEKPVNISIYDIMYGSSTFVDKFKLEYLEKYKQTESENFIKKVDFIQNQLNDLGLEIEDLKN